MPGRKQKGSGEKIVENDNDIDSKLWDFNFFYILTYFIVAISESKQYKQVCEFYTFYMTSFITAIIIISNSRGKKAINEKERIKVRFSRWRQGSSLQSKCSFSILNRILSSPNSKMQTTKKDQRRCGSLWSHISAMI